MDRFQQLLFDLSDILGIPLYTDEGQRCRLNINDEIDVQMEYDSSKERILIASFCSEISPGKFRENALKEALKANGIFPRLGTYGFSEQKNKLALFEYVPLTYLSSEKLGDLLAQFIERALRTKKAIETNQLTLLSEVEMHVNRTAFFV